MLPHVTDQCNLFNQRQHFIAIGQPYICYATVWHWKALVGFLTSDIQGYGSPICRLGGLLLSPQRTEQGRARNSRIYNRIPLFGVLRVRLVSQSSWSLNVYLVSIFPAGVFSGLVSHVVSAKFRFPRLVAQLASPAARTTKTETWAGAVAAASSATTTAAKRTIPDILPSLGASGAIYAAVTMTALAFPDSQIALFIPPSYPINIQYGVGGLMMLDMIGIARGWRCVFT